MFDSEPTNQELNDRLRKAEESLHKCEKLAIAGRYAVAVMHEVNNAFAAVNNLVYSARKEPDNTANLRQYMQVAEQELKRLGEITRKTLSFHRMEPQATECDLVKTIQTALLIHSHQFLARSIAVQTEFGAPVMAVVFEGEILQVFSNLILNALDALPQKNAQLRFRVKTLRERAHIVIADNGTGIHPSMHGDLFDLIVRARRREPGSASGFPNVSSTSIVKQFVFVLLNGQEEPERLFAYLYRSPTRTGWLPEEGGRLSTKDVRSHGRHLLVRARKDSRSPEGDPITAMPLGLVRYRVLCVPFHSIASNFVEHRRMK